MSLFPINDIAAPICLALSSEDIVALFIIDRATSIQLRELTYHKQTTVIKGDCEFGITEIITASVITHIAVSIYVINSQILHDIYTFQHHGSTIGGIINIGGIELSDTENMRNHLIIHAKNDIVLHVAIVLLCESDVITSYVFSDIKMHYSDCIATCLTTGIDALSDIFTFRLDLCNPFEWTIGNQYVPSAENDAKLLRLFEAN